MTVYNTGQIGTWIDYKTRLGYSGPKRNPNDLPASSITGKPIVQSSPSQPKVEMVDILKEIPQSTVKVVKTIGSIAKVIQEQISRSGASVAMTVMTPFIPEEKQVALIEKDPVLKKAKDIIFGKDPLKSLQTRIAETEATLKGKGLEIPFTKGIPPEQLKGKELPLAILGVGAVVGLDFTGWGGGKKQVVNLLAKTSKLDDVAKILKQINVADDLIPVYSKTIAGMTKADDVAKVLDKIVDMQKTTKAVKGVKEVAEEIPSKISKGFEWKPRQFLQSVKEARPDIELRVGGQYVPRSTDRLAIKAKTLIEENINLAEEMARTGTNDASIATASELIKHYGDEAAKTLSQATKDALYEKASEIAHITAKNLTDQGRAVQAAAIMGRLTPEGMLRFAAREINKYNEAVEVSKGLFGLKNKIPQLSKSQTEMILSEFKKIEAMEDGTGKAMAFKKLSDTISDLIPSSLYQKIVAVWKAGLLTGIKTSGLNTFSNLFHGQSEVIKDVPAVVIDNVASIFTKERTIGLTFKGTLIGTKEGFQKGWRYLKTGFDERNVAIKLDWKRVSFGQSKLAKGIQGYEETIFHILGAEDQPFYYAAKARSLQSQAIAQAVNKGLKGSEAKKFIDVLVESPTDEMLRYATNDAEIAVFQNPTMLGKIAKAIQNIPGGQFVVPFGRTPSAVAMQFVNYSPAGIVKTIIENIGKGKFDQRLFSQGLGRGITGTAIMAIGSELFKKGMINLSYPSGEREQKLWEAEGRTANSFYDSVSKKWRNVNVLGPAGFVLIAGANFQKSLEEVGSPFQALVQSLAGGIKSLQEQTFLQGISQFLDALNDPSRFFEGYFSNTISSVIPTIMGDLAKSFDEVQRRTPGILDKLKAKIPWLRQTLEPQITALGQEKPKGGNWIETMIDPSRPSKSLTSNVVQELRRITIAGYNVSPTQLGDKQGYKGLTPQENTALWEKTGELINSKLNNLFNLEQYKKLADDQKARMIEDVINKSKVIARAQAVMDLTENLTGQELKDKLSELKKGGLMTREVFEKYIEFK